MNKYRVKYKRGGYYAQVKWFIFWFTIDIRLELARAEDTINEYKKKQHPVKYWYYN